MTLVYETSARILSQDCEHETVSCMTDCWLMNIKGISVLRGHSCLSGISCVALMLPSSGLVSPICRHCKKLTCVPISQCTVTFKTHE